MEGKEIQSINWKTLIAFIVAFISVYVFPCCIITTNQSSTIVLYLPRYLGQLPIISANYSGQLFYHPKCNYQFVWRRRTENIYKQTPSSARIVHLIFCHQIGGILHIAIKSPNSPRDIFLFLFQINDRSNIYVYVQVYKYLLILIIDKYVRDEQTDKIYGTRKQHYVCYIAGVLFRR